MFKTGSQDIKLMFKAFVNFHFFENIFKHLNLVIS